MVKRRNIAFHKRSMKPWTIEEAKNILEYVGTTYQLKEKDYGIVNPKYSPFFDDGANSKAYMANWSCKSNLDNCKVLYYEDIFITEFIYPMWFKVLGKHKGVIVKFTSLITGEIIIEHETAEKGAIGTREPKGTIVTNWSPHTDISLWKQINNPKPTSYKEFNIGDIIQWHSDNDTDIITDFKLNNKDELTYERKNASGYQSVTNLTTFWKIKEKVLITKKQSLFYKKSKKVFNKMPDLHTKNAEDIQLTRIPIKQKENTMKPTIRIEIDGKELDLCRNEAAACLRPKTDLEAASKHITYYYDETGRHISTTSDSAKKATKTLQTPAFLGYTARTYGAHTQATTSIPVVTTKV